MTLLVIVEQHMTRLANGEVWTYDMVTADFWQRYLNVFDRLVVCGRIEQRDDNDTTGLAKSSRPEVEFVAMPNFRGVAGLIRNYYAIRKIIRMAIDRADCVIYRAPSPLSMVAYPIIKSSRKPFAFEMMNNPVTQYSRDSINSILQPFILRYLVAQTRSMCKEANGVSYVTGYVLQDLFPCRAMSKPCDERRYFTAHYSTINITKEQYNYVDMGNVPPSPLTIVHSGKMNDERKGQGILLRAVRLLSDRGLNIRLLLIGDGVIRKDFMNLASTLGIDDKVEFTGWKTGYSEVQKILAKAHIFAFPSFGEGLPRSVIEAMANGLITIASDVDGIKELLDEELLIHENTPECFADKIEKISKNWSFYEGLRRQCFEKSKEYENSSLTVRRTDFYKKLKDCCI